MSSAAQLIAHYPAELTGYEVAVQAMRKIGVSLSECQYGQYFLGTAWWWIVTPQGQAYWLNCKSGKLLQASGEKKSAIARKRGHTWQHN